MPVASTRRLWSDRTVFGRKVDHRRWARRLWWTFLATAALFVLFPRFSGPLWGMPGESGRGKTGLSDSMSPA